jgi:hypothetical protein
MQYFVDLVGNAHPTNASQGLKLLQQGEQVFGNNQ